MRPKPVARRTRIALAPLVVLACALALRGAPSAASRAAIGLRLGQVFGSGAGAIAPAPKLALLDRRALLAERKKQVAELRANTSSPQDDHDLLAHLRAAELNSQDPARRVLETDTWRRCSGINAKMTDEDWKQAELDIRRTLKCDFLGVDAGGRPVLVQHVGSWDVEAVEAAADNLERFVMLNAMICEVLLRMPRPARAKDVRGAIVIMDMEGLGMRHISTKMLKAFKSVAHVVRRFYPDILAHLFVVNCPWVFMALKTAIQPLFDADSLSSLHISSSLPKELQGLGGQVLPTELGGRRQGVFPYDGSASPSQWKV